mmetsp:Transcript_7549/g.10813  ORF Transcript_7549/g.10813 Transcript_7549/m.10813 type:complete len:267 (+) Transcript_7549:233-1033(+)|eukprot:CAMPEP_0184863468 /NCGR_PEP_ID=MMETSP0580-20130426/11276_1 /TAXON_ID=1118495 /ORGANISM="Dactyliosolen fragilissimus" /LENGTH=266 /DNA_ID=CAMNT_0027361821 /DNA_START=154 /DNA_END=954 /DNA_ORIENTATION=-
MADNWDDSDDDWDNDSDDLDARLNLNKTGASAPTPAPVFDDEEDLAVVEKVQYQKASNAVLKAKGNALAEKKRAEQERKEEEELARKAMEIEAEMEANMSIDERRQLEKKRVEDADNALTDDLFGAVDNVSKKEGAGGGKAMGAGDTVVLKDLKDHLKHATKVGQCLKKNGKIHLAVAFIKECIQESKDVLDDDAITEIIKVCNVIKNEKVAEAKRKVKGQAQKATKKRDKKEEAKARKMAEELYGANDVVDEYDEYGAQYEDDFF